MRKLPLLLLALGSLGLSQVTPPALSVTPTEPTPQTSPSGTSAALERLGQMFSPEIQETINACRDHGKVNVAAGAAADGSILCGDGSAEPSIAYASYVSTVSDILAASGLVGFRTMIQSDPRITPALLSTFLSSQQGVDTLRSAIDIAVTQSELIPPSATASRDVLAEAVLQRLMPSLIEPSRLDTLLGTPEQYELVVNQFCNAPGMSVDAAKQLVPTLDSLQLYAICIDESGIANEVLSTGG